MGSDARIYIFDDILYRKQVAPGIRQFVHTGSIESWLADVIKRSEENGWNFDMSVIEGLGFSFDDVCHYLGRDFSYTGSDVDQWSNNWELRACPSKTCPAKVICPLHQSRQNAAAEEFNVLLNESITTRCLGPGQFLGRTVSPLWYSDHLVEIGYNTEHPLFSYLKKLEFRGFVVGYQFSNSDGIHGWLTAEETIQFHTIVHDFDLPQFESSFEEMETFRHEGTYNAPALYSFKQLSLAFLRTVAGMAMEEKKGILWGNDI